MTDLTFYPRRGVHGELVDGLGRAIVSGRYAAGHVLETSQILADRDVSLTALREALRVLAGKGLVDSRQRRGTTVRPVEAWNQLDPDVLRWEMLAPHGGVDLLEALAEMRLILEPPAAALAAARRTQPDLDALERQLERMVETLPDPVAHVDADVAFHRALLAASGNVLLTRVGGIFEALLRARDQLVHDGPVRDGFILQHGAALAAIRDGDAELARATVHEMLLEAHDDARRARSAREETS